MAITDLVHKLTGRLSPNGAASEDAGSAECPFELFAGQFTGHDIRKSIRNNGFVVLRGFVNRDRVDQFLNVVQPRVTEFYDTFDLEETETEAFLESMRRWGSGADPVFYKHMIGRQMYTDSLVAYATGGAHRLYDLVSDPNFYRELNIAFPGAAFSISNVCQVRAIHPNLEEELEDTKFWVEKVPFHADIFYHVDSSLVINTWVPFNPCGEEHKRPSLEIVRASIEKTTDYIRSKFADVGRTTLPAELEYHPDVDTELKRYFGDDSLVPLEMNPGDVAMFSNWTLHRSYVNPGMTEGRTSAELRFIGAPDALRHINPRAF